MKIIVGVIAVVLLVNGCGLFKTTTKVKQSEAIDVMSEVSIDLKKEKEAEVSMKTDLHSFVWVDGETVTQLQGEDISITKDGTVRMGRGRVNQKSKEKSNGVQLMNTAIAVKQYESKQTALAAKQKVVFEKKTNSRVSKPKSSMFVWYCVGLIILSLLCFWWIRKKIR